MSPFPEGAVAVASPAVVERYKTSPTAPGSWSNVTIPLKSIPLVLDAAPKATANNPSLVDAASASANYQVPSDL